MTTYNKNTLKTYFQQGDIPTGTDYANFIDSYVNLVETAEQDMAGALGTTELITPRVSAANANFTSTISANNVNISGTASAAAIYADSLITPLITVSALSVTGKVSAASLNVIGDISAAAGTVYASAVRSTNGMLVSTGIISAAGTTQGAGAVLANIVNRAKGVVDGTTTGFAIPANRTGLTQYIYSDTLSANLWPPTGGAINALGANTVFPMTASTLYTIVHIATSAYAVK